MIVFLALFATFLFVSGIIVQIQRIKQRQMADDLSQKACLQWMSSSIVLVFVSIYAETHWVFPVSFGILLVGYGVLWSFINKYQHEHDIKMDRIRRNVMKQAKRTDLKIIDGDKK